MKTFEPAKKLSLSLALLLTLGLAGCDLEDLVGELADGGTGGKELEAPASCLVLHDVVGDYNVVGQPSGNEDRGPTTAEHEGRWISLKTDLTLDYDVGIFFPREELTACYDRRNQEHDRRIQASYGADDDGPVINFYMDGEGKVDEIQYRNRDEGINMRASVVLAESE